MTPYLNTVSHGYAADIYFSDYATARAALASLDTRALFGGLAEGATGWIFFLLSDIED